MWPATGASLAEQSDGFLHVAQHSGAAGAFVGSPNVAIFSGDGAVPVWFVPADAVREAIEDGNLTIGELAGLAGRLVGFAGLRCKARKRALRLPPD